MTIVNSSRALTPFVRYVTLRIYGRPFLGYLWFIWLSCVFFAVSFFGATPADPEYGLTRPIAMIGGFGIFIGLFRVGFLLFSKSGRKWIFATYSDDNNGSVSAVSIILVRLIPFVALATLIQFFR